VVEEVQEQAKKSALTTVAIFPAIMFACYVSLLVYFRYKGGYHAQVLTGHAAKDGEYTGGLPGPVEA